MLTETPVTQRSPCYSAVSSSLINPFPDCSNYLPFCHTHYLILRMLEYFTSYVSQARPLPSRSAGILYCCSALMQNLVRNACLQRSTAVQQAEVSGDVPPPLQTVISTPFCLFLFSLYLYPLSAPFPHFP